MSIELGNTFWKEVIAGRDAKIDELKKQIHELEAQLSIAFEVMTDKQIVENQHLFNSTIHIGDSASNNQPEGEN